MHTNEISTNVIMELALERSKTRKPISMVDDLVLLTGCNSVVAVRAIQREVDSGLLEYTTSLNFPNPTERGFNWLKQAA